MSVLIKGMEKPEHCGYCRFRYDGICHALQKTQYSMNECPLAGIDYVPDICVGDTISRQAAIDIINTYAVPIHGYIGTPNDSEVYAYARGLLLSIERNMRALPSIDAVQVIRCKDCKYYKENTLVCGRYGLEDDDYCSWAERRE